MTIGCCLGFVILLAALVLFLTIFVKSNEMEPPVFTELAEVQHFDSHELQGVTLSELPPDIVPIKLVIEAKGCNVTLVPDGPPGAVRLSGEYDTANGSFEFLHDASASGQKFSIAYRSHRMMLLNLGSDEMDQAWDRNNLLVHLPLDSAFDIEIIHEGGEVDLDLSGVPVYMLHLESKYSQVNLRNAVKNPLVMKEMTLKHSIGETKLKNLQNYRFDLLNLDFSMGEFRLKANDLFYRSATIDMNVSLGGLILNLPENVEIINRVDSDSGNLFMSEHEFSEKNATVTLEGRVKWGEASVSQ